jgi:hypothetical protein
MTMTERFGNRLGARILLAMGAVMLASSLIFLSIFAPIYHRQLLGEREMAPVKLGALLQITLQHAMLTRDLEGLRGMISDLGQSPNVAQATVLNPAGEVRFSSIQLGAIKIFGNAKNKGPIVSFEMKGAHPHDVATLIDRAGVAVRAGTHCTMPLLARYGVTATCRASFAMYNTREEVDALVAALIKAQSVFA